MCGICGKIGNTDIDANLIRRMCGALIHRGPDDEGVEILDSAKYTSSEVEKFSTQPFGTRSNNIKIGLGHRRLSIIDLSPAGHQPMSNEDESIWIVLNGEIYNFPELKELLEKKGHKFKSHSDTEVVLHLYEEKGIECLNDLRGMFAFAVWDSKRQRLFLARDRIGKKPLFYAFRNGTLTFASELNALLKDDDIRREIDFDSVDDFLSYAYIPAPGSIFKNVRKLPPAHFLIWEKGDIKIKKYWELDYSNKINLSEEEYRDRIRESLKESTKIRLISDVPLGAFLSGGIDSSAVVMMMAGLMDKPVKTFSIGFEDKSFDETSYAAQVAEIFGTEHREFTVKPNALEILPELILHFGEPYADPSAIPTYYLSKLTRGEVTVALNGDGGDESFGGYERYVGLKIAGRYNIPFSIIKKLFGGIIKNIPESTRKKDKMNRVKRFFDTVGLGRADRYARLMAVFNSEERNDIYTERVKNELKKNNKKDIILKEYETSNIKDLIDSALFVDLMTYMPGDLLPKVDITSMANSLEARSPFLDHKFLELSARIPSSLKIKGCTTKYILKKAFKDLLPPNILNRGKMGFGVPLGAWFRNELKDYVYDTLMSGKSLGRGYFKKEVIEKLLDDHREGKVNNDKKIWSLLNLELWHRIFIDGEGA
jgi:asparagine synthase (glutamine-hydrolysing)